MDFEDKVAVITGAASGIGYALCEVLAEAGAKIVAADVEAGALEDAVASLAAHGAVASGRLTDVSNAGDVAGLADYAYGQHDDVHLLFNNAGVFTGGLLWETNEDDWDWVMGVNLNGLVHAIRAFVPRMLTRGTEAHIVNTASLAGIVSAPFSGPYCTSKFAAVGVTECLHHDLAMIEGCRIGTSVVVPGAVATRISTSERNRPEHGDPESRPEAAKMVSEALATTTENGAAPRVAALRILQGIRAGEFYIPTNDAYERHVRLHNETLIDQQPPVLQIFE